MNIHEAGVSLRSVRYFFTPSSFAEQIFFYPTRVGHYFCDRDYHFTCQCETAMQPSHRFHYMLLLLRQGAMDFTIEKQHGTAERNDIVLFDCTRLHEYFSLTDDLEFFWMVFNGAMSRALYEKILATHGGSHIFEAGDTAQLHLPFTQLVACAETPGRKPEYAVSELIYSMLCRLLASEHRAETESLVGQAKRFVDQHFDAHLSVEEIASQIGLSASHLTKLFRQQAGYSPYEYITLCRIGHAKELLISTSQTVKQIAFETGYCSEENFIRSFKKKVGVSPTQFRKYPI